MLEAEISSSVLVVVSPVVFGILSGILLNTLWAVQYFSSFPRRCVGALLMWWWVMWVGKHTRVLWLGLSLLGQSVPLTMTFTNVSQSSPSFKAGKLEGTRVGYLPSPWSVRVWKKTVFRLWWKGKTASPEAGLFKNRVLWAYFKMAAFPLLLVEAWADFSIVLAVRTWCPRDKTYKSVGAP